MHLTRYTKLYSSIVSAISICQSSNTIMNCRFQNAETTNCTQICFIHVETVFFFKKNHEIVDNHKQQNEWASMTSLAACTSGGFLKHTFVLKKNNSLNIN